MTTTLVQAVGGIRVSTDIQQDRYGPDRQRADISREAQRAGLEIIDWVEESVSGADTDRGAENRYYEFARQRPGIHVIFSHPNRVGRHVEVTVGIARRLHKLGATVHIAGIGSLRDRRNWKEFLRDAVDAENDYSNILYNLSKGKFDKARKNLWPHGKQPYGYLLLRDERGKSTTLAPHPEHAAVYELAQELCLSGLGTHSIEAEFNRRGIREPRERTRLRKSPGWSAQVILRMLRNPHYLGRRTYRGPDGDVAVVTYPPLTTPERWQQVQDILSARVKVRTPRTPYPTLFGGHLECAECGSSLRVWVSRDREGRPRWAKYACHHHAERSTRVARSQPLCPHTVYYKATELDEQAWEVVVENLSDPASLAEILAGDAPDLPDHSERIDQIDSEMADILDLALRHAIPESAIKRRLDPLKEERARLEQQMQAQPPALNQDAEAMAAAFAQHLRRFETREDRRAALDRWGIRVLIGIEGIVGLRFRLALFPKS